MKQFMGLPIPDDLAEAARHIRNALPRLSEAPDMRVMWTVVLELIEKSDYGSMKTDAIQLQNPFQGSYSTEEQSDAFQELAHLTFGLAKATFEGSKGDVFMEEMRNMFGKNLYAGANFFYVLR
jgi:hypothetical protein